jgi:hypothetical protein
MRECFSKTLPDVCQCEGMCKYAPSPSTESVRSHEPLNLVTFRSGPEKEPSNEMIPSNPKDGVGSRKVSWTCIPFTVLWELGNAMTEGGYKYGTHNYRAAGVRASVYINAAMARHLAPWWEGEDLDPDSGESHITKAIASLVVLRDSMLQGNWVDDRPIRSKPGRLAEANARAAALCDKFADKAHPYMQIDVSYAEARESKT